MERELRSGDAWRKGSGGVEGRNDLSKGDMLALTAIEDDLTE